MTHHTPRSREEILSEIRTAREDGSIVHEQARSTSLIAELLLDIRDLMQNPRFVGGIDWGFTKDETVETVIEPEKDPLFDDAVKYTKAYRKKGEFLNARHLSDHFGCSYGRASALIDQLEAAGVISKPDVNGRRHVV